MKVKMKEVYYTDNNIKRNKMDYVTPVNETQMEKYDKSKLI